MFLIFTANTNKSPNLCTSCKLYASPYYLCASLAAPLFLIIVAVTDCN